MPRGHAREAHGLSLNVLGEFRDTNYSPDLDNPWLPWWEGMGNRPHWGKKRNSWYHSGWSNSNKYRPVSEYTWGNELVSRTDWDPSRSSRVWKNTNYYHQDVLGSTMALSDRNGNVVERYLYDVFGNAYEGTFQRANELGYTGQRYDAATGWYNYGYRDYAPAVGRFTTVDPIRDGNNWYAYVGNDPVNFVDPNGLDSLSLVYTKSTETLEVFLNIESPSGKTATVQVASYNATNNPQPMATPSATTIPTGENYYPQTYPNGTWDVTSVTHPNNDAYGPTKINTNASQEVDTYTQNAAGEWEKTGTTNDTGYQIHGGGYTGSPQGNNNVNDNTYGCIRMANDDVNALGQIVSQALENNVTVTLTVRCEE